MYNAIRYSLRHGISRLTGSKKESASDDRYQIVPLEPPLPEPVGIHNRYIKLHIQARIEWAY